MNGKAGLMKTFKLSLGLIVVAAGSFLFTQNQDRLFGQAKAPAIIENPEIPKYSGRDAPELVFKQELSIPLEGALYSFDVDEAGNIYLLDILGSTVYAYDKEGKFINKIGAKGQGPGEFGNPICLALSIKNRIHVLDRSRKTLQIFDLNGHPLDHQLLSSVGVLNSLSFDSSGSVYIQHMLGKAALEDKKRLKPEIMGMSCLSKFDSRFDKVMDVEIWEDSFRRRSPGGEVLSILYHDIFYYQVAFDDSLYYGNSSRYEIHKMTPQGRVTRIVKKKAKRIPSAEKDLANILEDYPDLKQAKDSLRISPAKPFFADFHVLDNVGLLVTTYADEWNDRGFLFCDLFDRNGVYIAVVKVPRYYVWSQHAVEFEKRNRIFKNDKCYSIVSVENGEALALVRHSVELKWPQAKTGLSILDASRRCPR